MLMLLVQSAAFDISEDRVLGRRRHIGVNVSLLRSSRIPRVSGLPCRHHRLSCGLAFSFKEQCWL